ncbi:MAG: type II secretion system secretin GspD [Wenzhouxiangellaceae bacterium]|nr:type II secretion system secretin GspD [Wenzhouxiangellaceae bacterium]
MLLRVPSPESRVPAKAAFHRFIAALCLLVVLIAGCATTPDPDDPTNPARPSGPGAIEGQRSGGPIDLGGEEQPEREGMFTGSESFPGTGVFINREAASREPRPIDGEGEITLNFEGQGIQEVIHAILGNLLQENYVIAPGISGEVTFSTAKPVAMDQVLPILEMLLRWNGATLIWRDDRFHVLPVSEAVRGNLVPRLPDGELKRGYQALAIPLEYVSATQMQTVLEPYAREDAVLSADNARSLIVLAGTPAELRNYRQIVETYDVDWLKGMSVGIFEIKRVEVADLITELEGLLGGPVEGGGEGQGHPLAGMFRIMPLERLNSIMVITPNDHYLKEVESWIERLDRSSPEAGARLYVYRVKNLAADVLAGYVAEVFGGTGGGDQDRSTRRQDRGSLAPGLERAQVSSVNEFRQETSPQARERRDTGGGGGTVTIGEDGDVRITAVMETNSLLIQASPGDYDAILNALERLDEEPLQVLIEAQVLIVALNDQLQYGVSWFLANSEPGDENFPGLPGEGGFVDSSQASNIRLGAGQNFFAALAQNVGSDFVSATISALESVSDVRTISAPSLMVRNNASATINVGTQVPIQSTSFTGTTDRVFGSTQFLSTGVTLDVTPRVNPGGLVYLEVSQEVSSPGEPAVEGGNPPINTRNIRTEVAVQSGQTVVLGGLIEETTTDARSGVPFLQRIPGLGALFRQTTDSTNRSETLVLITPTVVENTAQLERASDEFGRKFRALEPLRASAPNPNRPFEAAPEESPEELPDNSKEQQ